MTYRELTVPGAWEVTPVQHGDPRGVFLEAFQGGPFREHIGHPFDLQQANTSVSAAGVLRGIHFADVPPGQAKYVTCLRGAILDVVVDLRIGSATFGHWDAVLLDDDTRRAVYLGEGLGHAFMSLDDDSTVMYLCSRPYTPAREHGVHPLDPDVAIAWPTTDRRGRALEPVLSAKDIGAPSLAQALADGILPRADVVDDYLTSIREN